ncbi:MAG: bifunctional acetate--CoA ligase family protein/GNAT family N-acetyltransferase, partial [Betaproteobacteria bacterium]|nr:bifunctional acetate--CoA ligase family protein/GNAT family N-acetyltransferase [Betaproteobacteria bacterium]
MDKHYLTPLFTPESIVVFGCASGEAGCSAAIAVQQALRQGAYQGRLQFVDLSTSGTLEQLSHAHADLAVIALPEEQAAEALELAARMGCRSALIVSHGVSAERARGLRDIAAREGLQLLGPNSLGFQRPSAGLNASACGPLAKPGPLGLVSQSGALTASMLDWAVQNRVGFSSLISVGPHTAVGVAEALDFLANDGQTHSIILYLEGITNARRFMSSLRSAANAKPVIVLKAGRRPAGGRAAQTHSAASVGSDDVFDSALRRAGAVRVRSFVELFSAAKCLASRYRPVGRRLAVITNGGGPGVLAADWANEIGLELGRLAPDAAAAIRDKLPPLASLSDLIDLSEDATAEHYRIALQAVAEDRGVDGALAIHSPKAGSDSSAAAEAVAGMQRHFGKPLLACWMGDSTVEAGRAALRAADIPSFRTPEAAVGAFGNIATFYQNQQLLQQTPPPLSDLGAPDLECARLVIESVLAERRTTLTEMESKALLSAFHIPVTHAALARSGNEAMLLASQMGFPVALKIDSPDISHKSDVHGVALDISNGAQTRDTFDDMMRTVARLKPDARINGVTVQKMAGARRGREVFIGLVTDDPFGPVIVFGAGGLMVELIGDRAMELPPLNQFLARRLIERARVSDSLGEWRGAPAVNMQALEQLLLRVSEMVCELPQLREMDLNPVIVDEHGAVTVDARIVVDSAQVAMAGSSDRYRHLAIRPYPARFEQILPLPGGGEYLMRPVRPGDGEMLQQLVRGLSPQSRYFRFVSSRSELPTSMLARFTLIDYDREMALVAVLRDAEPAQGQDAPAEHIIGVSRYITNPDQNSCEFSLVVADEWSGKGIGSRLMQGIMDVARERGLKTIEG